VYISQACVGEPNIVLVQVCVD